MPRDYDIILFGATGFTGQYAIESLYNACRDEDLKFAVAGRSLDRLKEALMTAAKWMKIEPISFQQRIPKVIADVSDETSLRTMAKSCHLVLNTVGPYRFYGEAVIAACVEEGTNHLDISGEPAFIESMQLKYHEQAREKQIYIISACGFDSIPCETLLNFTKENFRGKLNSIETFLTVNSPEGGPTNTGTWNSAIHGVANRRELVDVRRQADTTLFPVRAEEARFRLESRGLVSSTAVAPGYSLPFLGSDRSVSLTSEKFRLQEEPDYEPVQIRTYFQMPSLLAAALLAIGAFIFYVIAQCSWGRNLLSRHPSLFSFGYFREGGATREQLELRTFKTFAIGKGWNTGDDETRPPSRRIVCSIEGPDPGYIGTSRMLVFSAVSILKDRLAMPYGGGCIPPGFAFERTNLRQRLEDHGFEYRVISTD